MSDRDALLAAILADPADDLPRLKYADWLDENGESDQSEFIRVQVELARTACQERGIYSPCSHNTPCSTCRHIAELRRREWELLPLMMDCLPDGWRVDDGRPSSSTLVSWQRGFASSIRLSWSDWLKHHGAIYWHPKQTVECPRCKGFGMIQLGPMRSDFCTCVIGQESTPGRIIRPFVATAHPIAEVKLTTWMPRVENVIRRDRGEQESFYTVLESGEWLTFTRMECSACDGVGRIETTQQGSPRVGTGYVSVCPKCHGEPLNAWTCPTWPTITFKMP